MILILLFIGHRGTRVDFDENTIEAFEIAIKSGANYIEFDIRKSKDNKLIVIHDPSIDRTTNGKGLLKNFTYTEIKTFKTVLSGNYVPLLSEVLEKFKGKTKFIIDLKEVGIREDLIGLINEKKIIEDCVFSGRILKELTFIKSRIPQSKICYNISKGQDLSIKEFLNLGKYKKLSFIPDMINLNSHLITPRFIDICHKNEILALTWDFIDYVKPIEIIKKLVKMDIDGILFENYIHINIIKNWLNLNYTISSRKD